MPGGCAKSILTASGRMAVIAVHLEHRAQPAIHVIMSTRLKCLTITARSRKAKKTSQSR